MVTPEYPPMQGGVGDYTSHLSSALRQLGCEVEVVTSVKAKSLGNDNEGVFDSVLPAVDKWTFSSWSAILRVVSRFNPDVLHIQYQTGGYHMHPAINLLPMRLRLSQSRPRLVVTFHDLKEPYLFPKAGSIRQLPAQLLAGLSDAAVATNPEDYERLSKESAVGRFVRAAARLVEKVKVLAVPIGSNIPNAPPPGFDRERWRHRLGIELGEVLLVYFGFLNESKGIDVLLEAFSGLHKMGLKARLMMAGGSFGDSDPTNLAYGQRIKALVEGSDLRSSVIWTGFTSRGEVSANLLASDICVLPFNEGASLRHGSLMAAIEHELPIVTTTTGSTAKRRHHPEFPQLDGAVKLVPPRDPEALLSALAELAASPSMRAQLSRSIAGIAPSFNWSAIGKAHTEAYDSILQS